MKKYISKVLDLKKVYGKLEFDCLGIVSSQKAKTLTFCERQSYLEKALLNQNISVIITTKELYENINKSTNAVFILVEFPKFEFWKLHNYLIEKNIFYLKIENGVGNNVQIHSTAYVDANTYIGNNVSIGANSTILNGCIIGDNSVIHNNCTIGSDGLQTVSNGVEKIFIKHMGGVKIGQNVHILSNSTISKAVDNSFTKIGDNTSISLLSSIGHNAKIGKNCNIAGNTLVGGSVVIGDDVWIGPSSTISDSIKIGNNVKIRIGSVVVKDVKEGEEVSGNFAYNHTKRIRNFVREQR